MVRQARRSTGRLAQSHGSPFVEEMPLRVAYHDTLMSDVLFREIVEPSRPPEAGVRRGRFRVSITIALYKCITVIAKALPSPRKGHPHRLDAQFVCIDQERQKAAPL